MKRHLITAALPYANGPLHLGHMAGVYVPADIYARYLRLKGKEVLFICGSDEHGVPITIKAKKEGKTPKQLVDEYHQLLKTSFERFGISTDHYGRTSSEVHHQLASDFFKTLHDADAFEVQTTDQLYDEQAQQFLADRFVVGTCPRCGFDGAYGDQCESCGASLDVLDLINPKSALTGTTPVLKATKHWFLPLQAHQTWLEEWHATHKGVWRNNVYGQIKSWLDEGLKSRAVTRDLDWGIPVPLAGADGKVLYVWFDAPIGYISATKEWAIANKRQWEPWWQDEDTDLVHFIGKDNIVFHAIIFPAMLKAHGKYILPREIPANEFLNLEGQKLSTSRNWAVWLHDYLDDFPDKQDVLRYVLTINAPENKDNDFTWRNFQAHNNNELVAIYGNFVNRTLVLIQKYYQGLVPNPNRYLSQDTLLIKEITQVTEHISIAVTQFKFREALTHLMQLARSGNKYLADEEPWKVIKEDPDRVATVLYVALQMVAALAILSEPFLPYTSEKLKKYVILTSDVNWDLCTTQSDQLILSGVTLPPPSLLFEKITDEAIQAQIDKLTSV